MQNFWRKPFFTGINYWDSEHATRMWQEFDEAVIARDMHAMREAGIDSLRVFPLWSDFQPLTGAISASGVFEYQLNGQPLPDTEAGRAGVSEEMCRRFERFCSLAEEHGLALIVGLITGQMSFGGFYPPVFSGSRNAMSNPTMCKWELRFVRYFVSRMRNQCAIVGWDLGNEVENIADGVDPDAFYVWCTAISNTIRASDPTRPVISGFGTGGIVSGMANALEVGEYCDIHTVHPYDFVRMKDPIHTMRNVLNPAFRARLKEDISGIPTFIQECGSIGYLSCSYESEAAFYRGAVLSSLAEGCHGFMWWCAFDQGHHSFPPYNWNNIGSQYGFFKEDRTGKPITEENRYVRQFLDAVPDGLPCAVRDACILLPRECDSESKIHRAAYLLLKEAGLDARFAYALNPIPDAELYLFPCPSGNKSITKTRWNELLSKIEGGARLMLTLSSGMFREIPEVFGVRIDSRYERPHKSEMILDGGLPLPFDSEFVYEIEATSARVLARDKKGDPVLFENNYGKGKTYLCTLPLEKHASERPGVFFEEDAPRYDTVYRTVAEGIRSHKISRLDARRICRTEHPVNENERYIFVINYARHEQHAVLHIDEGWQVEAICGSGYRDGTVTLRGNDGILLKAKRAAQD